MACPDEAQALRETTHLDVEHLFGALITLAALGEEGILLDLTVHIMRLLVGAQTEGDLRQEATLRVVDDRVIEAIGHHTIVVDAHHIDIADDQALFVGEARSLDEELTDLGDEALTREDGIRRALTIASGGVDVAAEVL